MLCVSAFERAELDTGNDETFTEYSGKYFGRRENYKNEKMGNFGLKY